MKSENARFVPEAMGMMGSLRRLAWGRWPLKIIARPRRNLSSELEIVPDAIREFIDAHRFAPQRQLAVSR